MHNEPIELDTFKYLCSTLMKNGKREIEINIRMATATSALFHLRTI